MDPELGSAEPLGAVAVETDDVLPRHVGGEGELALAAVHLGQDDLVVRVSDLHVHPDLGTGGGEPVGPGVVQLDLVVPCNQTQVKETSPACHYPDLSPWSRQESPQ